MDVRACVCVHVHFCGFVQRIYHLASFSSISIQFLLHKIDKMPTLCPGSDQELYVVGYARVVEEIFGKCEYCNAPSFCPRCRYPVEYNDDDDEVPPTDRLPNRWYPSAGSSPMEDYICISRETFNYRPARNEKQTLFIANDRETAEVCLRKIPRKKMNQRIHRRLCTQKEC